MFDVLENAVSVNSDGQMIPTGMIGSGVSVANNLITTEEGHILDARQGKVLKDALDETKEDLTQYNNVGITIGTKFEFIGVANVKRFGIFCRIALRVKAKSTYNTSDVIANVPSAYKPRYNTSMEFVQFTRASDSKVFTFANNSQIDTNGAITQSVTGAGQVNDEFVIIGTYIM